ncbi:MAG: ZIP family metal transporter [Methanomassiliicoccales archaeon]
MTLGAEAIFLGSIGSFLAGLATGAGALPILFIRKLSDRMLDVMLGLSAGIMLAATFFSLLIPAIDFGGVGIAILGIIIGALVLHLADRFIPHTHAIIGNEGSPARIAGVWLLILAMTIHNFPEGLAVGVSFGGEGVATGIEVATAIGLQNMPEGLAVALPLVGMGYSKIRAIGYSTLTGLVEPIGGVLGAGLVTIFHFILPLALAFAAGAMIFVVSDEMIPESHRKGFERQATFGLIIGFIVMMMLDSMLD